MELRSGTKMSNKSNQDAPVQPVTSRQCVIAFCENSEQLINICCEYCENKKFCQKHYMCMTCYLQHLHTACEHKRIPVCPLDRTSLRVDPMIKRMISCDVLLGEFWVNMEKSAAQFAAARAMETPVTGERRTVRVLRRQNAVRSPNTVAQSPEGVANIREAMEPLQLFSFPAWQDHATTEVVTTQLINITENPEIMQSLIDDAENIPPARADESHPSWDILHNA